MSNPTFLDSTIHPFRYATNNVSHASEVVDKAKTELLALSWTEENPPGSNIFISPANSAGQYMRLALSAPTQNRFRMNAYDHTGLVICSREAALNPSPGTTNVYYYTGRDHFFIQTVWSSNGWFTYAYLLDSFPDSPEYLPHPVVGNGTLNNAGSGADGYGVLDYVFGVENEVSEARIRFLGLTQNGSTLTPRMASGRYLFSAPWVYLQVGGSNTGAYIIAGKCPQTLIGPVSATAMTDWLVPITPSTSGTFTATFLTNYGGANCRLFMRKA